MNKECRDCGSLAIVTDNDDLYNYCLDHLPADLEIRQLRAEIFRKYARMTGRDPVGMGDLLSLLVGPDMIGMTKEYISLVEQS